MEPDEPPFNAQDLSDELLALCRQVIENLANDRELAPPGLQQLAIKAFGDEWQKNRVTTLEGMLKETIASLGGNFGDISTREAALRLFNLDGGLRFPDVRKRSVEYLIGEKKHKQKLYD